MRYLLVIIMSLAAWSGRCLAAEGAGRELTMRATPITVRHDARLWDLSDASACGSGPQYRVYGDTLVSERIDERRRWFCIAGDSTFYVGEETPLVMIRPVGRIATSALGNDAMAGEHVLRASGIYSRSFEVAEEGRYRSYRGVTGRLVIAPGDTLTGVRAVVEHRGFIAKLSADPIVLPLDAVTDTLERFDIETVRWFAADDKLPVALQRMIRVSDLMGQIVEEESAAWTINGSSDEYAQLKARRADDAGEIARRLEAASLGFDGNRLTVRVDLPSETMMTIDVSTPGGVNHVNTTVAAGAGTAQTSVEVGALPHGQYVVTLATAHPVAAKHLVVR